MISAYCSVAITTRVYNHCNINYHYGYRGGALPDNIKLGMNKAAVGTGRQVEKVSIPLQIKCHNYLCTYVCSYVFTYVCMYACMYVYM